MYESWNSIWYLVLVCDKSQDNSINDLAYLLTLLTVFSLLHVESETTSRRKWFREIFTVNNATVLCISSASRGFYDSEKTSNPCNRRAYMALSLSYRIKHQYLQLSTPSSGSSWLFLSFAPFHSLKWHYWIRFFLPLPPLPLSDNE